MKSFVLVPTIPGCSIIIHSLTLGPDKSINCIREDTDLPLSVGMEFIKEIR